MSDKMSQTFGQELLALLDEMLRPGSSVNLNTDPHEAARARSSGHVNSSTLPATIVREAHDGISLGQLIEVLLQILLCHPPYTNTSPEKLYQYRKRFCDIWIRGHSAVEKSQPYDGLQILVSLRMGFQRLDADGFRFVSYLLSDCIDRFSKNGEVNLSNWFLEEQEKAVKILIELLCSSPKASWVNMGDNFKYTSIVWSCMKKLTIGAAWLMSGSKRYERYMLGLSRSFFKPQIASSLLRGAVRVHMKPEEIFSVINALLTPLEEHHGVPFPKAINAFTPTPFNFPISDSLEKHDFTREYEFANLRILFISWINADETHRMLDEFRMPKNMDAIIQHPGAFERLQLHPDSCVRIALLYIFNEVELAKGGYKGIKPSTDLGAVKLLRIFVFRKYEPISTCPSMLELDRRECACIIKNAEWVLPWLWARGATDIDFVMTVTGVWMLAMRGKGALDMDHPMGKILDQNRMVLFSIFAYMFEYVFYHESIINADAQEGNRNRLLEVVLEAVDLMFSSKPEGIHMGVCLQILIYFLSSLERYLLTTSSWELVCKLLAGIPELILVEAFSIVAPSHGGEMKRFINIFLREIQEITELCEDSTVLTLPSTMLDRKLRAFTALLHFATLAGKANNDFCQSLAANTHFIQSMLKYVGREYRGLLLGSSCPELLFMHEASIGAACDILIITRFGRNRIETSLEAEVLGQLSEEAMNQEILKIITMFGNVYESPYMLSPICQLVGLLNTRTWSGKPLIYLKLYDSLRKHLLMIDSHHWCILVNVIVPAAQGLIGIGGPISQMLVENRWNLELSARLITRLKDGKVCCEQCGRDFEKPILLLVTLLIKKRPRWVKDLLFGAGGLEAYAKLDPGLVRTIHQRFIERHKSSPQSGLKDHFMGAKIAMELAMAIPEWMGDFDLAMIGRIHDEARLLGEQRQSMHGIYDIYIPRSGLPSCLVPKFVVEV